MADFKHLDFSINIDKAEVEVHKIIAELRPEWQKDKTAVKVEHMVGQLVGRLLDVVHDGNRADGLRVRVDGPMIAEVGLSRSREVGFLRHLNSRGVGVALLASFDNGVVVQLPAGEAADEEGVLMAKPEFAKRVAGMLAELHHAGPDDPDPRARDGGKSGTVAMARTCLRVLKTLTEESTVQKFLATGVTLEEIEKELDALYAELESLGAPVGLAHNAIWCNSIIHDPDSDVISITEYEMIDINFQTFDLASYLICLAGVPLNPAKRATPEFCRDFIRAYLQRKLQLEGKPEDSLTETEVEKYYVWTCKCCLLHLLFNVPNGLYTAYHRAKDMPFDFTDFVLSFYNEYKKQKEEYSSLKMPSD